MLLNLLMSIPSIEFQEQANRLTREIHDLTNKALVLRRKQERYEKTVSEEKTPDTSSVKKLFSEAGIHFADNIKRSLEEAKGFHKAIVQNRKLFLESLLGLGLLVALVLAAIFFDAPSGRWTTNRADFVKIGGGGLIGLGALLFSFRRTNELQRQNDITQENLKSIENHNRAQELQGSLQSGIEHLGHENENVRIGGIYELYNLAKDHKEQRSTVQNILCTYVRKRSNDIDYADTYHKEDEQGYQVAEEIQAILNILCSRES